MSRPFAIADDLRALVGVASEPWRYEVTTTGVRAFARGVGYTDPVYYDEATARAAGYRGLPAPPGYLGTPVFAPGHSHDVYSQPPTVLERDFGLPDLLDGGARLVYERTPVAGDVLIGTTRLTDLESKVISSLGPILIIRARRDFHDPGGELVAAEHVHLIRYRG